MATGASRRLAVVTGANQGIGFEIARALATTPGFHCILTSRDVNKGRDAVDRIVSAYRSAGSSGSSSSPSTPSCNSGPDPAATREQQEQAPSVEFHQLDITDPASVGALAAYLQTVHGGRLDVLINNAGFAFKGDTFGPAEARATIDVNFYGTIRVTEALLPLLKAAAGGHPTGSRVINVCSMAGHLRQVSPALQTRFQDPDANTNTLAELMNEFAAHIAAGDFAAAGWPRSMYGVSKLGEIAYTYSLARRVLHDGMLVAAVCPGYCATSMSSFKGPRSPAKGAETPVWLATEESFKPADITGGLWQDKRLIPW